MARRAIHPLKADRLAHGVRDFDSIVDNFSLLGGYNDPGQDESEAKLQNLQAMTPLKVSFTTKNGKVHYWFADPVFCTCLYTGDQDAYEHYQQLRLQQTEEQEVPAEEPIDIDFGSWGER